MLIDSTQTFDNQVALTGSRASTNVIDLGSDRNIGNGSQTLNLVCKFPTPLAGPAGTTLNVQFQTSSDNATFVTLAESGATDIATIGEGGLLRIHVPSPTKRYIALNYVVGGGPIASGTVFATLVIDRDSQAYYPRNFVS